MRITRDLLLKIAEDTVVERAKADANIIGAFLHGSLLSNDPLIGGATDIDLTFIYEDIEERREFIRMSDEIHLDIGHHPKAKYADGRGLREIAWEGSTIYHCKILYDPKHFLDFTQANVRGLFDRPESVLQRALPFLEKARRTWLRFNSQQVDPNVSDVNEYLDSLDDAANAVALLNGPPLTERRFLHDYRSRTESLGQPGLAIGLISLLGGNEINGETIQNWLPSWEAAYDAAAEVIGAHGHIHPYRKPYYLRAISAILESDTPAASLWTLLRIWTDAVSLLGDRNHHRNKWVAAFDEIYFLGEHFQTRLAGLDAYLDTVEEMFEEWQAERGI